MGDVPTTHVCASSDRAPQKTPPRMRIVMALVTGAMFMEILDGTIIVTALPAMARTFGTSPLALNVGIGAYLLALGVAIPASGWVAKRYGARRVFAAALVLFTLVSAACGSASGARCSSPSASPRALGAYAVPTFRASIRSGSFMRLAIGGAPFLLPLMFQVGFGYDAFHAGLLVLALFAAIW